MADTPEPPLTGVRFAEDSLEHLQDTSRPSGFAHAHRPSMQRAHSRDLSAALDLADPNNRQTPNPEVTALLEQKRQEHERARRLQQKAFEAQMRDLEAKQAAEEAQLLQSSSASGQSRVSPASSDPALAPGASRDNRLIPSFNLPPSASAPTTPPRSPSHAGSPDSANSDEARRALDRMARGDGLSKQASDFNHLQWANATAPTSPHDHFGAPGHPQTHRDQSQSNYNRAKSQPVSRRHSRDNLHPEDLGHSEAQGLVEGFDRMNINGNVIRSASSGNLRKFVETSLAQGTLPPGSEAPLLTSFLFDDELDAELADPSYGSKYLAMTDEDKFPILVKSDEYPGANQTRLSASSAALDLAPLQQTPPRSSGFIQHSNNQTSEWPKFNGQQEIQQRHRQPYRGRGGFQSATQESHPSGFKGHPSGPFNKQPQSLSPVNSRRGSPIAERKHSLGLPMSATAPGSPIESLTAQKRASLTLPPPTSNVNNLNSSDFTGGPRYLSYGSGPGSKDPFALNETSKGFMTSPSHLQAQQSRQEGGFGYGSRSGSRSMTSYATSRRSEDANRFAGLRLEDLQGEMASLCKDQHGCRFLQRKLEEGNPEHRDMIFAEVYPHFAELMVDSFGNYLAQRLLEFSVDEQKDILIASVHDDLVNISLNIHGTRAIQRLIDHLTTPRQIQALVSALNGHVVTLIKDLNGNHVIQKCLNSLKPDDNQFIYNAVTANCVEVATHRHGCCVLQRCIDHASETQRVQLVTEITYQCLTLVQDPFSNYVVQYCLEFDRRFVEAIIRQFQGNVCALSCHKFSSNVIEKCIRVADGEGRRVIIGEMLERGRLERLVKDNFANYVVQTACDFADPVQRDQLVAQIRPLLPQIRNTPYGKRIAARIQRMPQVNNNFMGYPMSGGFAYGPPQFGFGPGGSLIDAFHQRSFPSQAQLASAAFMPNPSGNDFSQYSMPQTTGASGFGAPPFPM